MDICLQNILMSHLLGETFRIWFQKHQRYSCTLPWVCDRLKMVVTLRKGNIHLLAWPAIKKLSLTIRSDSVLIQSCSIMTKCITGNKKKEGSVENTEYLFGCSQKQPPEMFCKKGVLRNFAKFTGKQLRQTLFLNKVARRDQGLQLY